MKIAKIRTAGDVCVASVKYGGCDVRCGQGTYGCREVRQQQVL
jgi:hypothetical protein